MIAQCVRWFSQLFALPVLSLVHTTSVYRPVVFRRMQTRHALLLSECRLV